MAWRGQAAPGWDAMHANEVHLTVPEGIEPELERQIKEYVKMRELGEQLSDQVIDPTLLT